MAKLIIKNIGKIVSGDIDKPVLEGSVIVVEDNLISAIGGEELLANAGDATVVDANGTTVTPGLWDSHVHLTSGDYGTRQKTVGFIESAKNGGVTTMISAGECHTPGRPKDPSGTKALAIVGHKSFKNAPPAGVKCEGGRPDPGEGPGGKGLRGSVQGRRLDRWRDRPGQREQPRAGSSHGGVGSQVWLQGRDAHRRHLHPRQLHCDCG